MLQDQPIRIMDLRGTYKGGGGPDKTILLSAKHHDPNRVHVLVTYLRDPRDKEFDIHIKAAQLGINYVDVPDRRLMDWQCLTTLSKLLKEHDIHLLHVHDDKTLLYGWLLKKFRSDLKIMYTCHSYSCYNRNDFAGLADYYNFLIRNRIRVFLMKRYQKPILTISNDTKSRMVRDGLAEQNIEVLPNGIDLNYWKRENGRPVLKEELGVGSDGYLVGTVARIAYDKDLPTSFRVVQSVTQEIPKVKFVIVGDGYGNEMQLAQKEAYEMGLNGRVFFTGHRNDLLNIYASLDVFLMTSLSEGMPNTVLEAMSVGVPVVSTNVGGIAELVVNGETGYLCEIKDVNCLSNKVVKLLKEEDVRKMFSEAGRERVVKFFSFADRVKAMERFYERICGC